MSTGWENHEPAPIEYLHGQLMKIFHDTRSRVVGNDTLELPIDGITFNNMIAEAKRRTYHKYKPLNLSEAVPKSQLS